MMSRLVGMCVLCAMFLPGTAAAGPIPFAGLTSVPGFDGIELTLSVSSTLSSADVPNPIAPADPVWGSSAPIFINGVPPTPGGPFLGFFKMPDVNYIATINDGTAQLLVFGAGAFSIAVADPADPLVLTPFLTASFANVVLGFENDGSGTFGFGAATFAGVVFDDSGLVNPGSFSFTLGEGTRTPGQGFVNISYPFEVGVTAAPVAAVPEPATLLLFGTGLSSLALRRRRANARRNGRTAAN